MREDPAIWTREKIIAAIRAWVLTYEEPPVTRDWGRSGSDPDRVARFHRLRRDRIRKGYPALIPAANTVVERFGSWNAAIEAAGFQPRERGGQADRNKGVTECQRGHPLTEENVLVGKDGRRKCLKCQRQNQRNYSLRKKAEKMGVLLG
jgi:hypothetical protein